MRKGKDTLFIFKRRDERKANTIQYNTIQKLQRKPRRGNKALWTWRRGEARRRKGGDEEQNRAISLIRLQRNMTRNQSNNKACTVFKE